MVAAGVPLDERREQAARPDGAVVGIGDLDVAVGGGRALERAALGIGGRAAGAVAADALVAAGPDGRRRVVVGIAELGQAQLHGDGGAGVVGAVGGDDVALAADVAGREQARAVDVAELATIDGPVGRDGLVIER